jgi:hypothetical protein
MFVPEVLRTALATLGDVLAERQTPFEIVVIGGGGLQLLGLIVRPTKDLDVLALVVDDAYRTAKPLPQPLLAAVGDVATALALAPDWLNSGPTAQLQMGLPDGFAERVTLESFGALTVHLAGRFDQICLKLYAAADDAPQGKHAADLRAIAPTDDELNGASRWVKTQDASPDFARFVDQVVVHLRGGRAGG